MVSSNKIAKKIWLIVDKEMKLEPREIPKSVHQSFKVFLKKSDWRMINKSSSNYPWVYQ